MKKARSWARRLLEHGLLGDGAGVRGSPDEVLDVRERPPVPHLCTNHEIRTTDDEWRRRRRKQLNHPRMDHHLGRRARASPPRVSDSHQPASSPTTPTCTQRLRIRFKKHRPPPTHTSTQIPEAKRLRIVRRTRRRRRRRIGRPPLSLRSSRRRGGRCLWTQEPRGDAEHPNAAGRRRR